MAPLRRGRASCSSLAELARWPVDRAVPPSWSCALHVGTVRIPVSHWHAREVPPSFCRLATSLPAPALRPSTSGPQVPRGPSGESRAPLLPADLAKWLENHLGFA